MKKPTEVVIEGGVRTINEPVDIEDYWRERAEAAERLNETCIKKRGEQARKLKEIAELQRYVVINASHETSCYELRPIDSGDMIRFSELQAIIGSKK